MKKIFSLFLSSLMILAACGQKTINDANAEVRTINGSFHAIEVSGGIDLYLSAGDEAVAVSAKDEAARARIRTEVKDGVLKIWYEWKEGLKISVNVNNRLRAYVSYKTLDRLSASGGSDVEVDGTIKSANLSINASGGSDFKGAVEASDLKLNASGGSDISIRGTARKLKIDASGGSDVDGYDLVSDECTVDASGGSDINITVNKELSAEASGASDVHWKGSATVKKANASGAGSVSHRS
jgi:hypothetical protein